MVHMIDALHVAGPLPLLPMRNIWPEFGWGGPDEPGPQTESSIERGFRVHGPVDEEWGRSESLDPDDVGDIADEGTGHRG
jgi:hypothetical protein